MTKPLIALQYGINSFADDVYQTYQPLKVTANYPDPFSTELTQAFATYNNIDPSMIVCGNGSDELIDLYIRIQRLQQPTVRIAVAPPAYYQYDNYARRIGIPIINLPHDRSTLSVETLTQHGCNPTDTILMLDSPSNPAGDIVSHDQFAAFLRAGYRVFADEAYFEFCQQTVINLLPKYPKQLVISRSLSKIAAMAGTRCGYLIADPSIIAEFKRQKLHFNVTAEAQHRALFALAHMPEFLACIAPMRKAKQAVIDQIEALDTYDVFSSLDMYVIAKHQRMATTDIHQQLRTKHGIETYLYPQFKGHDVIRATIASKSAMQQFTQALATYVYY